jgi:hypothetical protein
VQYLGDIGESGGQAKVFPMRRTALNLLCIGGYLYTIHQAQHTTSTRLQTIIIGALSRHLTVDYKTHRNEPEQQ